MITTTSIVRVRAFIVQKTKICSHPEGSVLLWNCLRSCLHRKARDSWAQGDESNGDREDNVRAMRMMVLTLIRLLTAMMVLMMVVMVVTVVRVTRLMLITMMIMKS